jgi:hypothetical protein
MSDDLLMKLEDAVRAKAREGRANGYAFTSQEAADVGLIGCRSVPAAGVSTNLALHLTIRWLLDGQRISRAALVEKLASVRK